MTKEELKLECLKYGHDLPLDLHSNTLYRCCHHDQLIEFVFDPYNRIEHIVLHKPEDERAIRLKEFVHIPFAVGDNKACEDLNKAYEDFYKAYEDVNKAYEDVKKAIIENFKKALVDYDKAYENWIKAKEDCNKARDGFLPTVIPDDIEKIIALVPDTKWNGKEIWFPNNINQK